MPRCRRRQNSSLTMFYEKCPDISMGSLIFWQNGHRGTQFAITTPDSSRMVVIDVGLCRSGRTGGAAISLTSGYSRKRTSRCATISAEGKKAAFPNQKRICRNAHRRVMMKAAPTAHFVIPQPDHFEVLVIAFNRPTLNRPGFAGDSKS